MVSPGKSIYKRLMFHIYVSYNKPNIFHDILMINQTDIAVLVKHLPSGKLLHNYGKSFFFIGKSSISMGHVQ